MYCSFEISSFASKNLFGLNEKRGERCTIDQTVSERTLKLGSHAAFFHHRPVESDEFIATAVEQSGIIRVKRTIQLTKLIY